MKSEIFKSLNLCLIRNIEDERCLLIYNQYKKLTYKFYSNNLSVYSLIKFSEKMVWLQIYIEKLYL